MATENQAPPSPGLSAPSNADPVTHTLALIQPWIDYVPKHQQRLGLFIFLALVLHISMFFFLRIDSTHAEQRRQTQVHVTMESRPAVSADIQAGDESWDLLSDPRLFILPRRPLSVTTPDDRSFDFAAINSTIGPSDFPPPASAGTYPFIHQVVPPLEERAMAALQPSRQPFFYDETPPALATKTTWQWSDVLASRQPTGTPELPLPISDIDLNPTEVRVAVDANGMVEHVLLEQSSKPELDQQAILALRKTRFQPTDQPGLVWGRATIFWHYSAKPREEYTPTPPTSQ